MKNMKGTYYSWTEMQGLFFCRSSEKRIFLAWAELLRKARLPSLRDSASLSLTHEINGTTGWPALRVKDKWEPTKKTKDVPVICETVWVWVICYRFEDDINVSGVKAFIGPPMSLLCMLNVPWKEWESSFFIRWKWRNYIFFPKMSCHLKTVENKPNHFAFLWF